MSVWTKAKNVNLGSNVNMEDLRAALKEGWNIELDSNIKSIRNTWGNDTCDFGLVKDGKALTLGLKTTNDNGVELVGDTWGTGFGDAKQDELMGLIAQQYNKVKYQRELNKLGWDVTSVETNEKGEIVINAMQY